jgi:hypothetical protein
MEGKNTIVEVRKLRMPERGPNQKTLGDALGVPHLPFEANF